MEKVRCEKVLQKANGIFRTFFIGVPLFVAFVIVWTLFYPLLKWLDRFQWWVYDRNKK